MGDWYTSGNISVGLLSIDHIADEAWCNHSPFIGLEVAVRNVSNKTIAFEYSATNFVVKDNLGNSYPAWGDSLKNLTLAPGATIRYLTPDLCCRIDFCVNYADARITEIKFAVKKFSKVDYAEWTIPFEH